MNICAVCGGSASLVCGGCKSVRYCSSTCQRRDWTGHKQKCAEKHSAQLRELRLVTYNTKFRLFLGALRAMGNGVRLNVTEVRPVGRGGYYMFDIILTAGGIVASRIIGADTITVEVELTPDEIAAGVARFRDNPTAIAPPLRVMVAFDGECNIIAAETLTIM